MVAEELAVVVEEGVAACLIGSKESTSSYHSMSFALRSFLSGPTAQSDIVGTEFVIDEIYAAQSVN
jgi:hypothetical protein